MGLQGRISRANLVRALLACGVGYSLLYVVDNDVLAASRYEGYSRRSQAVSELSAKGAPTRRFLAAMLPLSAALMTAFGIGVSKSAGGSRALRVTGGLLVAGGPMSVAWLPFPMSSRADIQRGAGAGNDVGHVVLSGATGLLVLSQMGSAAAAFGTRFRLYSLASAATVLLFTGVLTGREAANLAKGEPTPWMGLYERIGLGAWLLWIAMLAINLLRTAQAELSAARPPHEAGAARALTAALTDWPDKPGASAPDVHH
jgi:hypothetical protein